MASGCGARYVRIMVAPSRSKPALFVVLALAGACSRSVQPAEAPDAIGAVAPGVAGEVAALLARYRAAYEQRDPAAVVALYARGTDTVAIVQGRELRGFGAIEAERAEFLSRVSALHLRIGTPHVTAIGGEAATVDVGLAREYSDGAVTLVETGVLSLTLVRRGQEWLIAAEHFSYALR
jgi:uncharacterized protein (TIGR02246 family)